MLVSDLVTDAALEGEATLRRPAPWQGAEAEWLPRALVVVEPLHLVQ